MVELSDVSRTHLFAVGVVLVVVALVGADAVGLIGKSWAIVQLPQWLVCEGPQSEANWGSGGERPTGREPVHRSSGAAVIPGEDGDVRVSFNSTRQRNSTVFPGVSHDNVLRRHDGTTYLISQYHCAHVYRSDGSTTPTNGSDWEFVDNGGLYPAKESGNSVDTMLRAEGQWYAYVGGAVFTSESLTGEWEEHPLNETLNDMGVFHENGTFHAYYEYNREDGSLSGEKIGYATSPDGVSNWTYHDPVYTPTNEYKTGDYEIVEHDGVYFMFADYTREHPDYRVAVFASTSLSRNFTHVGFAARPYANDSVEPEQGIQDPTALYDETRDRYVVYAHAHESKRRPHWFTFEPTVTNGSAAT